MQALRWGCFGFGIYYGWSHKASLTHFVAQRNELQKQSRYEELVEEAKLAFETQYNKEQAVLAKAQGGTLLFLFS
jgi:hypothetical protein